VRPNEAPHLAWVGGTDYEQDGLHPEQGDNFDSYTYRIQYTDMDGDPPGATELHIKRSGVEIPGSPFAMSCASGDYKAGAECSYTKADFTAGSYYTYYFTAKDDQGNPSAPTTELNGPVVAFSSRVFLPSLLRNAGRPQSAPVLETISNPGGSYEYTLQWSQVSLAEKYTLEEDDNPDFSSPATAYVGSSNSIKLFAPGVGTYYYRVKASNYFGSSAWSNTQSVIVTVEPPPCPQARSWTGSGNHFSIDYKVVWDGSSCRMQAVIGHLSASCWAPGMGSWTFYVEYILLDTTIVDSHFETRSRDEKTSVKGDFTSYTTAEGTWSFYYWDASNNSTCSRSGTWTGSPTP
jgi:hypothetical protein